MKIKILFIPAIVFSLCLLGSCNSTPYEIEEVEDYSDTSVTTANSEIKQEVEQPKIEIKTEPSEKIDTKTETEKTKSQSFSVQLGAFKQERNAAVFTNKVNGLFNTDISYKLIDGLYKVRTGKFASLEDAISFLTKVNESGYKAFIIESGK